MAVWHQIWSLAFVVGVVGNLTASAILVLPQIRKLHKKIDANHREHMNAFSRFSEQRK